MMNKSLNKKIGQRIRMIRQSKGLKQGYLAKNLNLQSSLLSMYELGRREPPIKFLNIFCDYFHISLSQFFRFEVLNIEGESKSQLDEVLLKLQKIENELEEKYLEKINGKRIAESTSS